MTLRDLVRLAVLWSNRSGPALALNQKIYQAAVDRFVRTCRRFDAIRAIYLRHPPGPAGWNAGVSDIDLTVIVHDRIPPASEFAFLGSFWRRVSTLRSIFPMLGEIEVLHESHLDSWMRFGLEGRSAREWRRLDGDNAHPSPAAVPPMRFEREVFEYAFWFYLHNLMQVWHRSSVPAAVRLEDALRIERKIRRCFAAMHGGATNDASAVPQTDPTRIVLDLLDALDARIPARSREPEGSQSPGRRRWLLEQANRQRLSRTPATPAHAHHDWGRSVRSIYLYRDNLAYIVLANEYGSAENLAAAHALGKHFAGGTTQPVLLTPGLFAYMVAELMPYNYTDMLRDSRCVFGEPSLADIGPPGKPALQHDLVKQAPGLLMFPQSAECILPGKDTARTCELLKLQLDRAIALRAYLESGIVEPDMSRMRSSYLEAHPNDAETIARLLSQLAEPHKGPILEEWFAYFRTLIDEIHAGLQRDMRWEPFDAIAPGSLDIPWTVA